MSAIMMHRKDNVATLITDVKAGIDVSIISAEGKVVKMVKSRNPIPLAHKLAIKKTEKNEDITKYGENIGKATQLIEEGEHVHVHNTISKRVR